ncbi:MAG: TlpA family protein disulfide reductase [Chloroflexi bacterium]|nr:TlpA family protein disulfide reductase [Chloroflexota bacterium]
MEDKLLSSWRRAPGAWIAALAALVLVAAACRGGGGPAQARADEAVAGPPRVGQIAPDFTLERLDGGVLALRELRGRVVLVNFWATWCGPCKVEMPIIQQVYNEYRARGFEVVGVDFGEPREDAADFVQRGGFSWPFVLDSDQAIAKRYNVLGLPSSFFLDRQGIVRRIHVGPFVTVAQLKQQVDGLLSPPSAATTGAGQGLSVAARP